MEATYNLAQLKEFGFEEANDDTEFYLQYVLEPNDYFRSDYLYTEKVGIGEYKVVRYKGGLHETLLNWQLQMILNGDLI